VLLIAFRGAITPPQKRPLRQFQLTLAHTRVDDPPNNSETCAPTTGRIEVCVGLFTGGTADTWCDAIEPKNWTGCAYHWIESNAVLGRFPKDGGYIDGHIAQAVVRIKNPSYDTTSSSMKQFVMCQEIGHVIGLVMSYKLFDNNRGWIWSDHWDNNPNNPNQGTCMDVTAPTNSIDNIPGSAVPSLTEYNLLKYIYGHAHDASASKQKPRNNSRFLKMKPGPNRRGRLIQASNATRTYELKVGTGQTIITHVLLNEKKP